MDYNIRGAVDWYKYVLTIHKAKLDELGLTDNEIYRKIYKKINIMNNNDF